MAYHNIEEFLKDSGFEKTEHIESTDQNVVATYKKELPSIGCYVLASIKETPTKTRPCATLCLKPTGAVSTKVHVKVIGAIDDAERFAVEMIHKLLVANHVELES